METIATIIPAPGGYYVKVERQGVLIGHLPKFANKGDRYGTVEAAARDIARNCGPDTVAFLDHRPE